MKNKLLSIGIAAICFALIFTSGCKKSEEATLTTASISKITKSTASCGGSITSDGGAEVTARGLCWATKSNPTIEDNYKAVGDGTGNFTADLTGLTPNTTYYVRAYATNDAGTAYGNEEIFTTAPGNIGETYQGGIIFYILQPGDQGYSAQSSKGFIAASTDISLAEWGCAGSSISGTSTAIGAGKANTSAILNSCSENNIPAKLCNDFSSNGYDDWYLPSKDELKMIYEIKDIIGGFNNVNYWTSSQFDENFAWMHSFTNGYQGDNHKTNTLRSRPVRSF